MQTSHPTRPSESTSDAPLVPNLEGRTHTKTRQTDPANEQKETQPTRTDGGRGRTGYRFDPSPKTDYAERYTRDREEIEPGVADIR